MLLDKEGLLQNDTNIPTIYHWPRNKKNKSIPQHQTTITNLKYSTSLSTADINDFHRLNTKKYWWLHENAIFLDDLRRRARRKH